MANIHDISRDQFMLRGPLARKGYDWWWHSLTAENAETGEKKPFYIEFFTCNPARAKKEPVIVWNDPEKQKRGILPSYVMVNVGFWGKEKGQLHNFYAWKDVQMHRNAPYSISCGGCTCSETHTEGSVTVTPAEAKLHPEWMSDAGSMSWKLDIDKQIAFHVGYGASKFFRGANAFEMFWHAEGMKSKYSGEIVLNGVKYLVRPETCNGYADKNWGGDFTSPWVWLSSNNLRSRITGRKLENSVFNIGGGRPKIGPVALDRKLLGEFYYEGKDYEFNFSKFWTLSGTKFDCEETEDEIHWHVVQTTANAKLDTEIRCKKADMLNINYEAPTGLKRHNRLWNGGNGTGVLKLYKRGALGKWVLIDEVEAEGIGCEYGEYDQ
ncbi:MAG: hypothetical protein IJJ43_02800 [Oscillospiraceae bacterium]|nr:hypothetical protein [Oscillospiraceae bacterium]